MSTNENKADIPFLDMRKINERFRKEYHEVLDRIVDSGWYIKGKMLSAFEEEFADYCGVKHAIGVASGLDALELILLAGVELGTLQYGDEIIVPANTFYASILAIVNAGFNPVLVDPKPGSYLLTADVIADNIGLRTKVVMPVDLYGQVCDMDAINEVASENKLLVISDGSQSQGGAYKGKKVGNLAWATGISLYPGKNLGALGDAGAVCTNDTELANMIASLRDYGSSKKYYFEYLGKNSRLDELQAGFLSVKLRHLDDDNTRRREIAMRYINDINNVLISLPNEPENKLEHVWHVFVIRTPDREKLIDFLKSNGIDTLIHYPLPPHKQNALSDFGDESYPWTEEIHENILSIPISPVMTDEQVTRVIHCINDFD
ncbi:MAG: dTDP-4-amino-4,6-dideoxygalactose transaminase [Urechidicola sp.]|jgi:dTDP-4-amino-4,6-dideoxygalactose transaminase